MEQRGRRIISEIKNFYDSLIEKDELEVVYPKAIGNWNEDKENFTKYYLETIDMEEEIETDPLTSLEPTHLRDFKDELGIED